MTLHEWATPNPPSLCDKTPVGDARTRPQNVHGAATDNLPVTGERPPIQDHWGPPAAGSQDPERTQP